MNVGDTIESEILSNGMDGEGIARVDGKVVFVPYTLKGERVRAVIKQVKKKYALCSVIKILTPSEQRVQPSCAHYFKCGGCDMGHISPEYRREILLDELKNNLKKIAGIDYCPSEFVCSGLKSTHRNKLSMPFGLLNDKVVTGLYKQNTHVVEPVACELASELSLKTAEIVCDFATSRRLSVYDEKTGNGLLRHLVVREIGDRASATLVINADGFSAEKEMAECLPDNVDFFVCPNTRKNNVILGDAVRLVKGRERLDVNVLGVKAELSPLSFLQVNDEMRDKLYTAAIGAVSSPVLLDLYSGIGITSNLAAKKCEKVIAVEIVPQAVTDADRTAELNGNSDKITNMCGAVERVISGIADNIRNADVLIDPPRKGCGAEVMKSIAAIKPNKLIYISCNHATMCRDIKVFRDIADGYEIESCTMFDMFPNTHHTETLIILKSEDGK